MPKKFKVWIALLAVSTLVLAVVAYLNEDYAKGILLSFFRGEIAILYWIGHVGLSQKQALIITILASTISISNYFWLSGQASKPLYAFVKKRRPAMRNAFGITVGRFRQKPDNVPEGGFKKLARRFPYFILPLYNFDPFFGVLTGIVFAKSSKLNMVTAFVIMCAGNAFEKIIWSYLIKSAQPVIETVVIPIVFLSLGIVITYSLLRFLYEPD